MTQSTYNLVQQKIKIAQKMPNGSILLKYAELTQVNYLEDRNEEQQEEPEGTNEMTENDAVAFMDFSSTNGWEK